MLLFYEKSFHKIVAIFNSCDTYHIVVYTNLVLYFYWIIKTQPSFSFLIYKWINSSNPNFWFSYISYSSYSFLFLLVPSFVFIPIDVYFYLFSCIS